MILFCHYFCKLAGAVVPQTNSAVTKIAADYRNDKTIQLVTTWCSVDVKTNWNFLMQELEWADSARKMRIAVIYSLILCD